MAKNTTKQPTPAPKQIGTPKEPFVLEAEPTLVDGKPFFPADDLDGIDASIDDDNLAPDEGTADRYCAYELSILTGIPQRRIRAGNLTPAEVLILQQTQNL